MRFNLKTPLTMRTLLRVRRRVIAYQVIVGAALVAVTGLIAMAGQARTGDAATLAPSEVGLILVLFLVSFVGGLVVSEFRPADFLETAEPPFWLIKEGHPLREDLDGYLYALKSEGRPLTRFELKRIFDLLPSNRSNESVFSSLALEFAMGLLFFGVFG